MKNTLPFQIGKDYENWEYLLIYKQERIKFLDSYKYTNSIEFCETSFKNIELIFNLDILSLVILRNNSITIKQKLTLYNNLNQKFYLISKLVANNVEKYTFTIDKQLEMKLIFHNAKESIEIIYGNKEIISKLYP